MTKEKKRLLIVATPILVFAAFWLWSFNYASIYYFRLRSPNVYNAFNAGQILLPSRQVLAYGSDPRIRAIVTLAIVLTLVQSTLLAGVITLLIMRPWVLKPPTDGSRLAERKDLEKTNLLNGKPGYSVLLGMFDEKEVRYSGDSHFFVNGPSRSGKGRGFVMTNLLEWQGSAIVLDVKMENWNLTGAARLALGQEIYIFAPGSEMSHRWNPLDLVRPWPARATDLSNLAASLIPIPAKETQRIWKETARGLFAGILGYVLESRTMEGRRNVRSALRLLSTGQSFSQVLTGILLEEPELNPFIINAFRQHLGRDGEQRPSFEGNITTSLLAWNNLLMAEATSASDFDIRELRRNPFSIYIACPVSDFGTVEPIIRLLIQQIHDVMLRDLPGKDEPSRVLLMLDEFYQFEQLPEIIKRAPLVAGYGLTIALIAQNIPQIDERYDVKTRDALIGNMDVQLLIAIGDDTTAEIVSKNMGKHYVEREGWGANKGISLGRRASQGRFELVPLMPPDMVRRLDDTKTILQIRGNYSAILDKLNFYTDSKFVERRKVVAHFAKSLPAPMVGIAEEWPLFQECPAHLGVSAPSKTAPVGSDHASGGASVKISDQPGVVDFDDLEFVIEKHSRTLFMDAAPFVALLRQAIVALEDEPVTDILRALRERPDTLGSLRDVSTHRLRLVKAASDPTETAIGSLRQAIITARRLILSERAKAYPETQAELARLRRIIADHSLPSTSEEQLVAVAEAVTMIEPPAAEAMENDYFGELSAPDEADDVEKISLTAISVLTTIDAPKAENSIALVDDDSDAFSIASVIAAIGEANEPALEIERLVETADVDGKTRERMRCVIADIRASLKAAASDDMSLGGIPAASEPSIT